MSRREEWAPGELEALEAKAAQRGIVVVHGWDLARQLDIVREQKRRNVGNPHYKHLAGHAGVLLEMLAESDQEALAHAPMVGEVLIMAASFLGGLAIQGAPPLELTNMLALAGEALISGAEESGS